MFCHPQKLASAIPVLCLPYNSKQVTKTIPVLSAGDSLSELVEGPLLLVQ